MDENRLFWTAQAIKYKDTLNAVNFDPLEVELEHYYLKNLFMEGEIVCDLGCGNGLTTMYLASNHPNSKFIGYDYIPEMIENALILKKEHDLKNVDFKILDAGVQISKESLDYNKFDRVLTKRLLINLKGDNKINAINSIYNLLKSNGYYILVECFEKPLLKVNEVRKSIGLEPICVKDFNEYLSDNFIESIKDKFEVVSIIDFESLYYFTSRVYNAKLSEGEPDYMSEINKIAVKLSKANENIISGYGPEIMYVLKKIN